VLNWFQCEILRKVAFGPEYQSPSVDGPPGYVPGSLMFENIVGKIMSDEQHWSEASGEWYYVMDVGTYFYDVIRHMDPDEIEAEVDGMFILKRDGTFQPAPTTRGGWTMFDVMVDAAEGDRDSDDTLYACVGRVVDGLCVPIGRDDGEETDEPAVESGPCGAD
jgi:hypothetical protein